MAEVNIQDLKPNSHKYHEQQSDGQNRKIEKVIKGEVVSTKDNFFQKMIKSCLPKGVTDVKSYVMFDVIIPAAKNLIFDTLYMLFWNEQRPSRERNGYTTYDSKYRFRYGSSDSGPSSRSGRFDYTSASNRQYQHDDNVNYQAIVLRDRRDAQDVVDAMWDRIRVSGTCSVAEMFDMIGLTSNHTDFDWGWRRQNDIGLRKVSGGWLIDVAKAEYLEN